MFETAFTLLGSPVTWLELIAFVLALANIVCNVFEIHWGWPLTMAASALYVWLFYASKLYGEAGVNLFFVIAAIWGWWQWLRGRRAAPMAPLEIEQLNSKGWVVCGVAYAVLWAICGLLLRGITDSDAPWADGFVTAGSVVGTVLLGRKFIENWAVWLVVNAASVALFMYKGLHLTVVLYLLFFLMAIWGWLSWNKRINTRQTSG
jgi:nicotinamide mononucleotide transporter